MTKILTCRDIGVECDAIFEGETDEKIMEKAKKHAASDHNMKEITPNIEQQCLRAIKVKEDSKKS